MRFTREQYVAAIANLSDALDQLVPDGRSCAICHDSGHQAWECGHNPLYAMACCTEITARTKDLHEAFHATDKAANDRNVDAEISDQREDAHELLHALCGACSHMGSMVGPAKVVLP
jgi:hypothetical protein